MAYLGDINYSVETPSSQDVVGAVRYYLAGTIKDASTVDLEGHIFVVDVDSQETLLVRRTTDTSGAFIVEPIYTNDPVEVIAVPYDDSYNMGIFRDVVPTLVV